MITPDPSPLPSLLRDLRGVGTGEIAHGAESHGYSCEQCPVGVHPKSSRDLDCAACRVLLRADEALDGRILDANPLPSMTTLDNAARIMRERDEARAEADMEREVHAVTHGALLAALAEIDTLRLLVVAGRVEMRERAAEVAEDCDHDNCAAAIRALDPVPAAKP